MSIPVPRNGSERGVPVGDVWSSPETADDVLAWLEDNATAGEVQVSLRALAAALDSTPITMRRALRRLIDHDRLVLVRVGTGGGRYTSRYRLAAHDTATAPVA